MSQWLDRRDDRRIPGGLAAGTGSTSPSMARVVLFAIGAAIFTTLVVGLLPALRTVRPNLVNDLKEGGRGRFARARRAAPAGRPGRRAGGAVLRAAGRRQPDGAELPGDAADRASDSITRRFLTGAGYLAGDAYDDVRARAAFYRKVVDTAARDAGRRGGGGRPRPPPATTAAHGQQLVIDGRTSAEDAIGVQSIAHQPRTVRHHRACRCSRAAPSPMRRCRIRTRDVAMVNQELARRLWPGESPLDRRIGFRDNDEIVWLRVVGVAPNVHYEEVGEDTDQSRLNVYVPVRARAASRSMAMLVRAQAAPESADRAGARRAAADRARRSRCSALTPMSERAPARRRGSRNSSAT